MHGFDRLLPCPRFSFASPSLSTSSFHPSRSVAAWLPVLEARRLATVARATRDLPTFWLKIFGVAFRIGVVSRYLMAFHFVTNWSVLSNRPGPIQGPRLSTRPSITPPNKNLPSCSRLLFFGVPIFGRSRVRRVLSVLEPLDGGPGDHFSAFLIMVNNSWNAVPNRLVWKMAPSSERWLKIILQHLWFGRRISHCCCLPIPTLLDAFCVAATGCWYVFAEEYHADSRSCSQGLVLAAVLMADPLFFAIGERCLCHTVSTFQDGCIEDAERRDRLARCCSQWPMSRAGAPLFAITLPPPFGSPDR